ncbi:Rv0361 family membrane protein [Nocardia australiensis]|uniref:Rv0361 family membrane protein n=1 Tax=Nocardia australiensis TaxID=2887191 RepID=UPI001D150D6C|nr:hypothetical protein [Nocardia australiensis]
MSDQQPGVEDEVITVDQTDSRSAWPFIVAAVVAALVLVAVILGGVLSPAEKNVTEADKIAAAVRNYADARGRTDVSPPPGVACVGFDERKSSLTPQVGDLETGKAIEITEVKDPMVDGDRAKATVTTKIDGHEATGTWSLTRSDDRWLICN